MDRSLSAAFTAGILLLMAACGKEPSQEQDTGLVEVTFSVFTDGEGTRTSADHAPDEIKIKRWALLLYQDGKMVNCGTTEPGNTIKRNLQPGDYQAYAVVNYPDAGSGKFRPFSMLDLDLLAGQTTTLEDNAAFRFVMSGSKALTIAGHDGKQILPVERLVSKTGIRKISLSPDAPALARKSFILKAIYLTNCIRSAGYLSDTDYRDLATDPSQWIHPMGYSSDADTDGLLADIGIDAEIRTGSPYMVSHYFYCYPNPIPATADTRSAQWAPRCTRMVIEAQVGDRTCYYPITLPSMKRNMTYIAEEVIIRSLGSADPEQEIPGSLEVVFSTENQEWAPLYTIDEVT
jgi:hypothetical protein